MAKSIDLLFPYGQENKRNNTLLSSIKEEMLQQERLHLTPNEFVCQHHDFVEKVRTLIAQQFPNEILDLNSDVMDRKTREKIEAEMGNSVQKMLLEDQLLPSDDQIPAYLRAIFAEILGFGVLEVMLEDPSIDEIIVQNYDDIQVERRGILEDTPYRFASFDDVKGMVLKIARPLNMEFDTLHPNFDAQLSDGSRVSAAMPPYRANGGISMEIRKFAPVVHPLKWYVEQFDSQAPEMAEFEEACVRSALNILISGGTGSGKTTALNSLSMAIHPNERIVTIEDTLELKLPQKRVEAYQTIAPNIEGKGGLTMQQAIINTLRKRPERIIVGEIRGAEAVEMINAMNTGHDGSLSTIHSNSPRDCIERLMVMILSNKDTNHLSETAILKQIQSAIHLIIQTNRMDDGTRKITHVSEIVGFGQEGFDYLRKQGILKEDTKCDPKRLYMQDIFCFKQTSMDRIEKNGKMAFQVHGRFETTGYVPRCHRILLQKGEPFDKEFFAKRVLKEV